mgnify:CR=1 FL=1
MALGIDRDHAQLRREILDVMRDESEALGVILHPARILELLAGALFGVFFVAMSPFYEGWRRFYAQPIVWAMPSWPGW